MTDYDPALDEDAPPAADDVDDIDAQIAFLQAIRDVRVRRQEAYENRASDPEGWQAAKQEHAEWRSYFRQIDKNRVGVDASVTPATAEGSAALQGVATNTEA